MKTPPQPDIRNRSSKIAAVVVLVGLVLLGALGLTAWLGDRMVRRHAPLVDASLEIKLHLTMFHLWLEQYLYGDREGGEDRFWTQLDEAEWYVNAMLEGGENQEGRYVPVDDPALRNELYDVKSDIESLRAFTLERLDEVMEGGEPARLLNDKAFDRSFLSLLNEADHIEAVLVAHITDERESFRLLSLGLFGFAAALCVFAGGVLMRYERKRLQDFEELATSREDLRVTLNSLGDGVITTGVDGHIKRMNPEAETLTGWKESEAAGKPFRDVFRLVDERTLDPLEDPVGIALETGKHVGLHTNALIMSRGGSAAPVDDTTSPTFGPDGRLRGAVVVVRDATSRREFEKYLNRFKFVMDNSSEEFYLVSPAGRITYANRAAEKSLGYPKGGMVGMQIGDIDPNMHAERYAEYYAMLYESDPGPFETTHIASDGRIIEKEIRFGRIDYFGESYACAIARDISDRKRIERTKTDFYSMVTHDLRSPMTTLLGFLELIETSKADTLDKDTFEMFGSIKSSAIRVYSLINDFLTLSRLESGALMLQKMPVSPTELATRLAGEFAARARAGGLDFATEIRKDLPHISADTAQIERAFSNLIENAINYTKEGGSVKVGAKQVEDGVSLYVEDTGPGIDPDEKDLIFSKYYRAKKSSKIKGTGLGLAIVDAAAKAHGGRVELESEPGRGSRFEIILPLGDDN